MEKGNAVDPAAALGAVRAIDGVGDRVTKAATTAVIDVTAGTAESMRNKLVDRATDAALDGMRDRIKPASGEDTSSENTSGDDDSGSASSQRPEDV
jgi:hypothetical protein